jgi:hypothetical protein
VTAARDVESSREIWDVTDRCTRCGTVRAALVSETGLGHDGEPFQAVYVDRVPHSQSACDQMLLLAREEWPTLW